MSAVRHMCRLLTAILATAVAIPLSAQVAPGSAPEPDARAAGERLALRGAQGIAACSTCHGALGEGSVRAGIPRIAGFSRSYLALQLQSFANGRRDNKTMSPIARKLDDRQIEAVSAYYARVTAPPALMPSRPDERQLERGRILAMVGDEGLRLQACINCHGPAGTGEPPRFPYLAGQHRAYLVSALKDWKEGKRKTDPSGNMNEIARLLNDEDRAAVAAYFAVQAPPVPAEERVNIPMGSIERPTRPAAASMATPKSTKGIGVEQGAPTTGGNQGPGGGSGAGGNASRSGSGGDQ
ncbi:hypothetical protein GCM10027343_36050 [Noviherbaspirillum agri]